MSTDFMKNIKINPMWILVDDKLPKDGQIVLVALNVQDSYTELQMEIDLAVYNEGAFISCQNDEPYDITPDYWMEIPLLYIDE